MSLGPDHIGTAGGAEPGADSALRRSLRQVTMAWIFGAAWFFTVNSAAYTKYGELLGLSKFMFGLLAALPCAASLIQIPASYLIEKFGHQKVVFIVSGMMHRATWILVGLVPFILPHAWWATGLLAFVFLQALIGSIPVPIWYTWMGELVPSSIRGRYFSRRTQVGQFVGLLMILAVGVLLDLAEEAGSSMVVLDTISLMMVAAGVVGMVDFIFFLPVIPPSKPAPNTGVGLAQMLGKPLADRNFLRFLGFWATMMFGIGFVGQFLWLYLLQELQFGKLKVNILLLGAPLLITMAGVWLWGRLIDRFGRKPVLVICGLMVVFGSVAWIFVTRDHLWLGYAVVVVATFAWPGIDLANFNILLGMCETLGARKYRMGYIVIFSMVGALAGFASGIAGGMIAQWLGDWRTTILGWPLTYHGVLFIISGVLRLIALIWLIGLVDARAYGARETLKYMAVELVSGIQQAASIPFRVAGWVGRWTYKVNPRKPSGRKGE